MKQEQYKIGDRILVRNFWGSVFHAYILIIKKGLFGNVYYCKWGVNDDLYGHYEKSGKLRSWNIIGLN